MKSEDPRVNRLDLESTKDAEIVQPNQCWEAYEVFVQQKQGGRHIHEGSLHAADNDMALVFAKEQFGRRGRVFNIWVVKSSNVYSLSEGSEDMFASNREKKYRNSNGFKVSDKITQYKKEQKAKEALKG